MRLSGAKLGEKALTSAGVREIMELASQHHYQIACTRLFELSRKLNTKLLESVSYPHQFYEWSTQGMSLSSNANEEKELSTE